MVGIPTRGTSAARAGRAPAGYTRLWARFGFPLGGEFGGVVEGRQGDLAVATVAGIPCLMLSLEKTPVGHDPAIRTSPCRPAGVRFPAAPRQNNTCHLHSFEDAAAHARC